MTLLSLKFFYLYAFEKNTLPRDSELDVKGDTSKQITRNIKKKKKSKENIHNILKYKQNKPKGYQEAHGPNKGIFLQLVTVKIKPTENLKMLYKKQLYSPKFYSPVICILLHSFPSHMCMYVFLHIYFFLKHLKVVIMLNLSPNTSACIT